MSLPRQSSVSPLRDKHCSDFFFTLCACSRTLYEWNNIPYTVWSKAFSLNVMCWDSSTLFAFNCSLFHFVTLQYSIILVYHGLFVYSAGDGHMVLLVYDCYEWSRYKSFLNVCGISGVWGGWANLPPVERHSGLIKRLVWWERLKKPTIDWDFPGYSDSGNTRELHFLIPWKLGLDIEFTRPEK